MPHLHLLDQSWSPTGWAHVLCSLPQLEELDLLKCDLLKEEFEGVATAVQGLMNLRTVGLPSLECFEEALQSLVLPSLLGKLEKIEILLDEQHRGPGGFNASSFKSSVRECLPNLALCFLNHDDAFYWPDRSEFW